jgi:hypothetical protein
MSETPCSLFDQPECTACDPRVASTPLSLVNPPGQKSLRYRVGDFVAFRQAMLDALTIDPVRSTDPASPSKLQTLTSRTSDDYAVGLLEMWAYVCDVLTFYQQAIANEAFLRTAVLRESLARVAALIGYEPARGVSATAWLAFFADPGAKLTLPAGLQTQSIPPPGANPATFETSAALAIDAAANQPVLLGPPQPFIFTTWGELLSDARGPRVAVGTRLLFYSTSPVLVSEQVVTAVKPASLGRLLEWNGNLNAGAGTRAARSGRKFRIFGANAPGQYLKVNDPNANPVTFTAVTMKTDGTSTTSEGSFYVPAGRSLFLDNVYDSLSVGGRVVVQDGGAAPIVATITSISQSSSSRGPLSGTCTVLGLDVSVSAVNDLRTRTIYELIGDDLRFRGELNGGTIAAGSATVWVAGTGGLRRGMQLILTDGIHSDVVKVTADPAIAVGISTAVSITPALRNSYQVAATKLYANTAQATHGERQIEQILGDGNAARAWQEFAISISPISFVPDPAAESGASSTLRVFVDGFQWTEVPSFYGRGPEEAIFTTRVDENGKTFVRFGDGKTGRRLPTGSRNIRALLRKGIGKNGNTAANTISVLLQPQPGLKSVTNPLSGFGGIEPETAGGVKQNAPSTVVTLGRAVSLRDYEALALDYRGGVAKARAAWAEFQTQRGVALTIAAAGGGPIDSLVQPLRAFLDQRRDPNVPLSIGGAKHVHFIFRARVHLLASTKQSAVKAACEAALGPHFEGTGYLDFEQLQFGQSIFQSALLSVLQGVAGVDWVELIQFSESPSAQNRGFGSEPLKREAVFVDSNEIGWPTLSDSDASAEVALQYIGGVNDLEVA